VAQHVARAVAVPRRRPPHLVAGEAEPAVLDRRGQGGAERALHVRQRDPVLRALGPGERRLDRAQVELDDVAVGRRRLPVLAEQALRAGVGLSQGGRLGAVRRAQVAQRLLVDREVPARRAVLGRHVRDRRAVGQRQRRQAVAEELDELVDDPLLAQALGDGQHEVGGGHALLQATEQAEPHHPRRDQRERLAEHGGLGLDAADAPAQHAQPVDHGRVRIRADQRVGVRERPAVPRLGAHHAGQVLEVHLVDDAGRRRHDAEVGERLLAPAQELVALAVPLELDVRVLRQRVAGPVDVDLDRVVDDQVDGHERVDARGVAAQRAGRVAHGREVDDAGYAGEVLQHDARGQERQLAGLGLGRVPAGQALDVLAAHAIAVDVADQRLEQDADRHGQAGKVDAEFRAEQVEPVDPDVAAGRGQGAQRVERGRRRGGSHRAPPGAGVRAGPAARATGGTRAG
jgi:hypothetical protein